MTSKINRFSLLAAGVTILWLVAIGFLSIAVLSDGPRGDQESSENASPSDRAEESISSGSPSSIDRSEPGEMLLGPTVVSIDVYVSPSGSDTSDGRTIDTPVRSDWRAGELVEPGSVVYFLAGRHPSFRVDGWQGSAVSPITLQPAPGAEGRVVVSDDDWNSDAAIWVVGSNHVVISGLKLEKSLWAMDVRGSSNIRVTGNTISFIGQEAIRLREESNAVEIDNNSISDTGNRPGYTLGGSGIYVGTSTGVDPVHDVYIHDNDIFDTASEGIDVKPGTWNITIEDNLVHDLSTLQSGAIVLHLGEQGPSFHPNLIVRRNMIWNIRSNTQWADGNGIVMSGAGVIENNIIFGNEHRALLIEQFFTPGAPGEVLVRHNTFFNNGRTDVEIRGDRHDVDFSNNLSQLPILGPWEGSGNRTPTSSDFANAGSGVFDLAAGSGAIDSVTALAGIDTDYARRPRSMGASPDAGALEFAPEGAQATTNTTSAPPVEPQNATEGGARAAVPPTPSTTSPTATSTASGQAAAGTASTAASPPPTTAVGPTSLASTVASSAQASGEVPTDQRGGANGSLNAAGEDSVPEEVGSSEDLGSVDARPGGLGVEPAPNESANSSDEAANAEDVPPDQLAMVEIQGDAEESSGGTLPVLVGLAGVAVLSAVAARYRFPGGASGVGRT